MKVSNTLTSAKKKKKETVTEFLRERFLNRKKKPVASTSVSEGIIEPLNWYRWPMSVVGTFLDGDQKKKFFLSEILIAKCWGDATVATNDRYLL